MLGSIPHQKNCFYHLPTRGRAGIKLGDAWYVSNVSIIFDCSMLLYYLFWMFMGFIIHFYIIFGTNLLTQSPVPVSVFFLVLEYRRKGKPNGVQLNWNFTEIIFGQKKPTEYRRWTRRVPGCPRGWGRAHPPGRAPCLVDSPEVHRRTSSNYIYPYTLKTSGSTIYRDFRRQKPP